MSKGSLFDCKNKRTAKNAVRLFLREMGNKYQQDAILKGGTTMGRRRGVMSEQFKYELAKDLGFTPRSSVRDGVGLRRATQETW